MIKSFLILTSISILLFSSEQIILVISDDLNSSVAKMECYEDATLIYGTTDVNLGANGLGWGIGVLNLQKNNPFEPKKVEGDKKAPLGIFKLTSLFGYSKKHTYNMPYLYASKELICVDDSNSPFYNHIITALGNEKSFEYMRRKDIQYKFGIVVEHNKYAKPNMGSCIFMHIEKGAKKPTAGCTSMKEHDIINIMKWLDKSKHPILIQIPKSYSKKILELYPNLKSSKILRGEDKQPSF